MMSCISTLEMEIVTGPLSIPPKSRNRKRRSCFTKLISRSQVYFFITSLKLVDPHAVREKLPALNPKVGWKEAAPP